MTEESSNDRWQIGAWRTKYESLLQEHLAIKRSMKEAATASPIKADELRDIEARALAVPHDVTVTTSTDPAEHGVAVARFVAYARTDVPRLLSEIHRLNAAAVLLRGEIQPADDAWFASGGGILRSGPYRTQRDAYSAMELTHAAREKQRQETGVDMPYPRDVAVWPEYGSKR